MLAPMNSLLLTGGRVIDPAQGFDAVADHTVFISEWLRDHHASNWFDRTKTREEARVRMPEFMVEARAKAAWVNTMPAMALVEVITTTTAAATITLSICLSPSVRRRTKPRRSP